MDAGVRAALAAEAALECSAAEWREQCVADMRGYQAAMHARTRAPTAGAPLVRADLLARAEARASGAARELMNAHLASIDAAAREYERAVKAFSMCVARLRFITARAPTEDHALAEDEQLARDGARCILLASLEARLAAYDNECSWTWHAAKALRGALRPDECQALIAGLRVAPFLSERGAMAARTFLAAQREEPEAADLSTPAPTPPRLHDRTPPGVSSVNVSGLL
jgi:hypothetical protein